MQRRLLVAWIISVVTITKGQLPIPSNELGFIYKDGQPGALVKIAAYIDLTCPYSKASYATLLKVAEQFLPSQFQLKVHLFSLPYHRNSHTISKAAHVLNAYKPPDRTVVYEWIGAIYTEIDTLSTAGSVNKTDKDVLDILAEIARYLFGIDTDIFKAGVANATIDAATRLEWEYGLTRGVYGTPSFTVNDVFVGADSSWNVTQWVSLINQVLRS